MESICETLTLFCGLAAKKISDLNLDMTRAGTVHASSRPAMTVMSVIRAIVNPPTAF